jgi:hypothetical protein
MVTGLVKVAGSRRPLPVKTRIAIPKGKIAEVTNLLANTTVVSPKCTGDVIIPAVSITDGLVVLGGSMTGASKYINPPILKAMRSKISTMDGKELGRILMKVYDLDNEAERAEFIKGEQQKMKIYGSEIEVDFDPQKRIGLAVSKLGAGKAIAIGAYAFALDQLDRRNGVTRL